MADMNPGTTAKLAALLVLAGAVGPGLTLKVKASRTSCAACGGEIPPGKPGRRCKACREG